MKVGDYVRTKNGIARIIDINDDVRFHYPSALETDTYLEINDDTEYVYDEDIIKSSPNIIDLIEVGDYVNGFRVDKVEERYIWFGDDSVTLAYKFNYDKYSIKTEDIKSIVTKEQFESMEYRIGE